MTQKFIVGVVHTALNHYTVEAENETEALDLAWKAFEQDAPETLLGNEYDNADKFYVEHYKPELVVVAPEEIKSEPVIAYESEIKPEFVSNSTPPEPSVSTGTPPRVDDPEMMRNATLLLLENVPVNEAPEPAPTEEHKAIDDAATAHNAATILAAEDERILDALDKAAAPPDALNELQKDVEAVTTQTLEAAGMTFIKAPDPIQEAIRRGRALQSKMFDKP